MRHLLTFIQWFNHLWDVNLTPAEEARQIVKYLVLKKSTAHSIELYLAVQVEMQCEMTKRENEAQGVCKAVKAVWHNTKAL